MIDLREHYAHRGAVRFTCDGELLGLGDGPAGAGIDRHATGDRPDCDADYLAEFLRLRSMEFACAAGDEDTAGSGVDALGDML